MSTAARALGREALLFSTLCVGVLFGLSLVLIGWRVQQLLTDLAQQRLLRLSQQMSLEAERSMRVGVALAQQTAWLARQQQEPQLLSLRLQAIDGTLIAQAGDPQRAGTIAASWQHQLWGAAPTQRWLVKNDDTRLHIGRVLADAKGQARAQLWISADLRPTQAQARAAARRILGQVAPLLLLTLVLASAALWRLGLQWQGAARTRSTAWLALVAALVCAATPPAMLWSAHETARPLIAREVAANADALALSPAMPQGARAAAAYPSDYVDRQLDGMLLDLDLALSLIVSAVLLLECARGRWHRSALAALAAQRLARCGQGKAGGWAAIGRRVAAAFIPAAPDPATTAQLIRLRLVIFLIALSEELLRPFFTVFAIDMPLLGLQLTPTMVAGLPVAAFMATLALAQPVGPLLARRMDPRWGLVLSALVGSLALMATGAAQSGQALVSLRALAGMAYGLALILAQTALVRTTSPAQRARGMAQIAGAIVAAGIVGPPIGGMVAAQAGPALGFAACALCLLLAAIVSQRLTPVPRAAGAGSATGGWRGYAAVLRHPRALAVIFGAGLPARLVAVTLLAVVVPLQMSALEQPAAMAGRALLLYFLVFAVSASWVALWSDTSGRRTPFLVAGGLTSALACWALPGLGGVPGMAVGCALLGLGQALQSSPQLALVTELFEPQTGRPQHASPEQALTAFRLLERLGSIAAPFATAWAVAALGHGGAMWAIGLFLAAATLGMLAALRPSTPVASLSSLPELP